MVRNYKRKTNIQEWSLINLKQAVNAVLKKEMGLKKASIQFNVPKTTIRSYVQKKIKDDSVELTKSMGNYVCVFSPGQETEFVNFLQDMEARLFGLTMRDCRRLAFQLAEKNNLTHPFNNDSQMAGEDWMKSFLSRHPELSLRKPEATSGARAMGFNRPSVNKFFDLLKDTVDKHKLTPDRIYNCDETGITVNPKGQSKIIASRGKRQVGALTSAERGENVTVELCVSAAGSYMPPMLVFPRKRMQKEFLLGLPPGAWAEVYESGWMTSDLFLQWLRKFVTYSKATKDNCVLLILDGHTTHTKSMPLLDYARENGVIILCLPPHTSHRLQPLDVAFMKPLSGCYEEQIRKWLRTNPGKVVTLWQVASLFGSAFINAACMRTAINGFEKTGIWPVNPGVFQEEDFLPSATTDIVLNERTLLEPTAAVPSISTHLDTPAVTTVFNNPTSVPDNSVSVSSGTPTAAILISTKFPSVSPSNIMPVPQVKSKEKRKTNRRKGISAVLTSSPYKLELQAKIDEATKKKEEKEERARKRLEFNNKKGAAKQKISAVPKKIRTSKSPVEKDKSSGDSSNSEEDPNCLYCDGLYSKSVEGWIRCQNCHKWSHSGCAGIDDDDAFFVCDFCL